MSESSEPGVVDTEHADLRATPVGVSLVVPPNAAEEQHSRAERPGAAAARRGPLTDAGPFSSGLLRLSAGSPIATALLRTRELEIPRCVRGEIMAVTVGGELQQARN